MKSTRRLKLAMASLCGTSAAAAASSPDEPVVHISVHSLVFMMVMASTRDLPDCHPSGSVESVGSACSCSSLLLLATATV